MAVMANLRISGSTSCFKQSHLHPFPTCSSVSRVSGTTGTTPLDLDDLGFRGSGTTGTTGTTGTARLPSMVSSDMGRSPVAESSCAIGCGYPGRFAFEPTEPRWWALGITRSRAAAINCNTSSNPARVPSICLGVRNEKTEEFNDTLHQMESILAPKDAPVCLKNGTEHRFGHEMAWVFRPSGYFHVLSTFTAIKPRIFTYPRIDPLLRPGHMVLCCRFSNNVDRASSDSTLDDSRFKRLVTLW